MRATVFQGKKGVPCLEFSPLSFCAILVPPFMRPCMLRSVCFCFWWQSDDESEPELPPAVSKPKAVAEVAPKQTATKVCNSSYGQNMPLSDFEFHFFMVFLSVLREERATSAAVNFAGRMFLIIDASCALHSYRAQRSRRRSLQPQQRKPRRQRWEENRFVLLPLSVFLSELLSLF